MVALRKESVDRNADAMLYAQNSNVALRKESVDRNLFSGRNRKLILIVALRKESVDRNLFLGLLDNLIRTVALRKESVDRNRYWVLSDSITPVALRKESVDRNFRRSGGTHKRHLSLSVRRAWIEIPCAGILRCSICCRSP